MPPFTDIGSVISGLSTEVQDRWRLAMSGYTNSWRIVPTAASPIAFWHVEPKTGALLGVLESGAGGAEDSEQYEQDMNKLLDLINRLANLASAGGVLSTAGGTWLSLELTKAKKLLGAIVVLSGGTPSSDPSNWNDFGCNAAMGAAGGGFNIMKDMGGLPGLLGQLGDMFGKADNIISAGTGHSPICG
ncbi:MAG: hypothetical protein R3B13_14895 [Polyangiaceae bacterium]